MTWGDSVSGRYFVHQKKVSEIKTEKRIELSLKDGNGTKEHDHLIITSDCYPLSEKVNYVSTKSNRHHQYKIFHFNCV